ncbi:hypothetical protein DMB66_60480, partial [Actinoplanes sp. ATCC 53533]
FLRVQPRAALAAIEKEAIRRMGRGVRRGQVAELRILEPGLWSAHSGSIWEMELRLAEKQGAELRILAPDEPEARAAFEATHAEKVHRRKELLATLAPHVGLFANEDADDSVEESVEDGT